MRVLRVLSAGAARKALLDVVPEFEARVGVKVKAEFGAVGVMAEVFATRRSCDVLITSQAMRERLAEKGLLQPSRVHELGYVQTSIAAKVGDPVPDISTPEALCRSLLASDAIFCPDVQRATAGIHFQSVLQRLGILDQARARLHALANGAAAMLAMVNSDYARAIGCTQETEIIYTDGVAPVGALPEPFGLATKYVAVNTALPRDELARQLIAYLEEEPVREVVRRAGFERC